MTIPIIIFSYQNLGKEIATYLQQQDYQPLIVDYDQTLLSQAKQNGFQTQYVDYQDDHMLQSLGIGQTIDTVFCLFPADRENVFVTLAIRQFAPNVNIIASIDEHLAGKKLLDAGANRIIDHYDLSGQKITELINKPLVVGIFDNLLFGQADLEFAEINLSTDSTLNQPLSSLNNQSNVIILGVATEDISQPFIFSADNPHYLIQPNDTIVIIGSQQDIHQFKQQI